MHLDPPGLEPLGDEVGGAVLLEAEFRMGVEVAPPGGQLVLEGADVLDRVRIRPPWWGRRPRVGKRSASGRCLVAHGAAAPSWQRLAGSLREWWQPYSPRRRRTTWRGCPRVLDAGRWLASMGHFGASAGYG